MATRTALACLALVLAAAMANADDNDLLLGAINDFCVNPRGNIEQTASLALRSPHGAPREDREDTVYALLWTTEEGISENPGYTRVIYFAGFPGGAILTLNADSTMAPVGKCQFVGYSDDMAGLAKRLHKTFDLPEPTIDSFSRRHTRRTDAGQRPMTFELEYGFQEGKPAGSFTLNIKR